MRKYDFPAVPIVLAIVLGLTAELELFHILLLFNIAGIPHLLR